MKSKLLPLVLIILILLNGILIFVLIKKPHQNNNYQSERNFLIEQLQFSESQKEKFINLDESHKVTMMDLSHKIREQKDILFNSFGDDSISIDSLVAITGNLEVKKELEVFNFFKTVRKICTSEQQKKFDEIIKKAIRGGNPGSPQKGGNHSPRGEGMPPPPR